MKISSLKPKSSFLSAEKDLNIIVNKLLSNERLKRLLYYNSSDALKKENITEEQSYSLIGKNIITVPKLYVNNEYISYIIVTFDNFSKNETNPEFRDNIVEFDIICNFDLWRLDDMQLRPYKIAAEIDSMLDKTHLTGIGKLEFLGANQLVLNSEYAGICLMYQAIHGDEDKKPMPNPNDEERFLLDFEEYVNNLEDNGY